METVLFIGVQAAGKSSFYGERFFDTHVRINLDMLKTRFRERLLFDACLQSRQSIVVDNTNLTHADRLSYIEPSRRAGFAVIGYYFRSAVADCLARNATRPDTQRVPDKAILGAHRRLVIPSFDEGFDNLYYIALTGDRYVIEEWRNEV